MKNWLRTRLNKNYGVILNVDNSMLENDGKFLTIKIPLVELEKFGLGIEPNETTIYKFNNEKDTISGILGRITINKYKPGFNIFFEESKN